MKANTYQALCDAANEFDGRIFSRTTCGDVLFSLQDDKGRWHTLERVENVLAPMGLEGLSPAMAANVVYFLAVRLECCVCTECGFVESTQVEEIHLECETPALADYKGKRVCEDCVELIVDEY